jgi:hypothetical protein
MWDQVSDPVGRPGGPQLFRRSKISSGAPHRLTGSETRSHTTKKLLGSRGNCSEYFLLQTVGRRLIQALGDQYGVALHINDDRPVLG